MANAGAHVDQSRAAGSMTERFEEHPIGWGLLFSFTITLASTLLGAEEIDVFGIGVLVAFLAGLAVAGVGGSHRAFRRGRSPPRGAIEAVLIIGLVQITPVIALITLVYYALRTMEW